MKEIICTILHCIELDFKYGSSLCLETILYKCDKERFWGTLVYSHSYCMVFAYLVGCRITPTINIYCNTGSETGNTALLHMGALQTWNPSRCYLYMINIYRNTKDIHFSGIGAFLFIVWKIFEGFCDFF